MKRLPKGSLFLHGAVLRKVQVVVAMDVPMVKKGVAMWEKVCYYPRVKNKCTPTKDE